MDITLVHNPEAGDENLSAGELVNEFERAGHQVSYYSIKSKNFPAGLDHPAEMVVVAGGDGTFRKVASQLIGRDVPMAILPLGTANNIARSLGLPRAARKIVCGLDKTRLTRFDVGLAKGPWGEVPFFEGAGVGLFPRMMSHHLFNKNRGVPDAVEVHGGIKGGARLLRRLLGELPPRRFEIRLDDLELAGNYLLIEAMNIPSIGPALELAPKARPADGLFEVVIIGEDERQAIKRHISSRTAKKDRPSFPVYRVRHMQLSCRAAEFHFDDELWPGISGKGVGKPGIRKVRMEIELLPGALRIATLR